MGLAAGSAVCTSRTHNTDGGEEKKDGGSGDEGVNALVSRLIFGESH